MAEASLNTYFPHPGRASVTSAIASDVITLGGDGMLPVYGHQESFTFVDFMANYGNNHDTYFLSPGIGYRKTINHQIFGGYFFSDYNKTNFGAHFWVLNPGIEWMSSNWDGHVNGYFPTTKSKRCGHVDFASNYGDKSSVTFQAGTHNQYDLLIAPFDIIGNGVDAELGFSFAKLSDFRSRLYAGAYYYHPPSSEHVNNISGFIAGFEQALSKNLKLSVFNSYDNLKHNVVGLAFTATLGQDSMVFSNNIDSRLLDPVERHVGTIKTGAGIYDQRSFKTIRKNLQYDNVYFIVPSTGYSGHLEAADLGTYGNPAPLNQATLDSINQLSPRGSRIYIQGGTSAHYTVDSTTAIQSTNPHHDYGLVLYSNQDLFGRSTDYTTPATQNERPQILVDSQNNYNGFIISGTENTLSDLIITPKSGYINGSTPTTSTGIIAYNESEANQTINITNTTINRFADGMYAQNDSLTSTLTINASNSHFDNNGGDQGLNTIQMAGYNLYGAAGLIAINNNGNSNSLIINASNSSFNNNGTFSGESSGINNNNFSVASGLIAINNSDTGTLTLNIADSTFNHNGTLSGLNTYLLANEAGPNFNSINTAAATGLYALDNSFNNGAITINATHSTFNNNGTLSGENALIQAGGPGLGDNINNAITAGIYAFNNSSVGSSGGALLTLNANNSSFNYNGTLSGLNSNIFIFADNASLGASDNAAAAAGVFSYNNNSNNGSNDMNVTNSTFNNNGTLSGTNSYIYAHTSDLNNVNESVIASTSGIFAYNANNQGTNNGLTTITADSSNFNNNGELSGNGATIQSLNDNGISSNSGGMASAAGISGYNIAAGALTINSTYSHFNNNGALSGIGSNVIASGSDSNSYATSGLFIFNNSSVSGNIFVNNLSGSDFNNNGAGTTGYGIYAYTPNITGMTIVDTANTIFGGTPQINTNQGISDGTTQWIP